MSAGSLSDTNLEQQQRQARRRWQYALVITVATTLNFVRLIQAEPLQSANDRSRWTTVWSLVERGTYQIDEIRRRPGWDTIDLVKHEDHFYSSKPPLFPTVVAGLYWGVKHTLRWTLDAHLLATTRLLLVLINLIPMTIALVLLARLIDVYSVSDFTRYFLLIAASTATLLQPFLVVLNNHTPGAVCCVFTLYAVIQILVEKRQSGWLFAAAGFWAACTCCVELPAALFGVAVFFLLAREHPRQTLAWFVPAALLPLGAFLLTNYLATGGWKPFYLYYGTDKYEFFDNGVPSYWMSPRGVDRAQDGMLTYLLHCLVGHHGVLSLTPLYLLTLKGWLSVRTWEDSPLRRIHTLGLLLTAAVFCFFLTKTENYNYGGVSVALRWLLWLTPFWLLAIIPALDHWRPELRGRAFCLLLLAVSVFSAWYPLGGPWRQPWLFNLMEQTGWIDYSDPPPGPRFHTWIRQLPPDPSQENGDSEFWIEFEGINSEGELERLRIEDVTRAGIERPDSGERDIRLIRFLRTRAGAETVVYDWVLAIDVQKFEAGLPLEEIVVWSQGMSNDSQWDALDIMRGLPEPEKPRDEPIYRPRRIRYVDQPFGGREKKFQCMQATGEVLQSAADHAPRAVYRRDIWMTDDVPFGVLMFETSVRNARSGEILTRQTLRAVDASHVIPFDPSRLRRDN